MLGRRAAFWVAVGGVSVLTNFLVELAARRLPSQGLRSFVSFIHAGPSGGE